VTLQKNPLRIYKRSWTFLDGVMKTASRRNIESGLIYVEPISREPTSQEPTSQEPTSQESKGLLKDSLSDNRRRDYETAGRLYQTRTVDYRHR
jgi:hypothetical protein